MPTRPTLLASFATDATLTSGPQSGLSTRLDPGVGTRGQGFYQDRRLPARALSYLLGILGDWVAYFDPLVTPFSAGGTLTPTSDLSIATPTTHTISINGSAFSPVVDGGAAFLPGSLTTVGGIGGGTNISAAGNITAGGYARFAKRIGVGINSGSFTYQMTTYDHVYLSAVGAVAGTVWNIGVVGANYGEVMRIAYLNNNFAVIVKDPGGTTLATLQFTSGNCYAITVWYNGTSVIVIDQSFHP